MNRVELLTKKKRLSERYAKLKLTSNNIHESEEKVKIADKLYWRIHTIDKSLKRISK